MSLIGGGTGGNALVDGAMEGNADIDCVSGGPSSSRAGQDPKFERRLSDVCVSQLDDVGGGCGSGIWMARLGGLEWPTTLAGPGVGAVSDE